MNRRWRRCVGLCGRGNDTIVNTVTISISIGLPTCSQKHRVSDSIANTVEFATIALPNALSFVLTSLCCGASRVVAPRTSTRAFGNSRDKGGHAQTSLSVEGLNPMLAVADIMAAVQDPDLKGSYLLGGEAGLRAQLGLAELQVIAVSKQVLMHLGTSDVG
jgi:hypothetical protein